MKIDLNSDLGESFGAYKIGMDDKVLPLVTSANIACGFHAGDPSVMKKTVGLAVKSGAALGAHPGYPDLVGFGRRKMAVSPADVYAMVGAQCFCQSGGHPAPACKAPRSHVQYGGQGSGPGGSHCPGHL